MQAITTSPRLILECLEERNTPSGNVSVFVQNGNLFIRGDDGDNQVGIQQSAAGDIVVYGINGTTVNGTQAVPVGRGIPANVVVELAVGRDYFESIGLFAGNIQVHTGNGVDAVALVNTGAAGNIEVYGGEKDDTVFLSGVFANHLLWLDGGNGTDSLHIDNSAGAAGTFIFNFDRGF